MALETGKPVQPHAKAPPAITVNDLSFCYPGQRAPAIDRISFSVARGEIFGLLGPSGAGKSTLQKVLTRQQRRFDGKADVLGRPLSEWGQDYFEAIGVGFELPNHYVRFSAVENLHFFRRSINIAVESRWSC